MTSPINTLIKHSTFMDLVPEAGIWRMIAEFSNPTLLDNKELKKYAEVIEMMPREMQQRVCENLFAAVAVENPHLNKLLKGRLTQEMMQLLQAEAPNLELLSKMVETLELRENGFAFISDRPELFSLLERNLLEHNIFYGTIDRELERAANTENYDYARRLSVHQILKEKDISPEKFQTRLKTHFHLVCMHKPLHDLIKLFVVVAMTKPNSKELLNELAHIANKRNCSKIMKQAVKDATRERSVVCIIC